MGAVPDINPRTFGSVLKDVLTRLKRLESRSGWTGTGMRPNGANGTQVDGDLIVGGNFDLDGTGNVDGSLNIGGTVSVDGAGTVGGTWKSKAFNGNLTTGAPGTTGWAFNNNRAIMPELILRPGSVTNDALANPVVQTTARAAGAGFALTTSYVERAGITITIPDGCTQVQALVIVRLYAVNQNTTGGAEGLGTDAIYVKGLLSTEESTATPTGVSGSFGFATSNGADSFVITGLVPGSTIRLAAQVKCNYQTIPAYVDNRVTVVASLTWLR